MMKAFDVPQEAAYTFFEKADTDKSGKLERSELVCEYLSDIFLYL